MPDEAPAARYQTPDEALATDLALIAQAAGWTAAEAAAYARAEAAIDRIAVRLATDRPDVFVGSALASDPGGAPRLFVKGPADPELIAAIRSAGPPDRGRRRAAVLLERAGGQEDGRPRHAPGGRLPRGRDDL
ncbi:MAG: hypothetical protein KatS3mg065_1012 [Chloroflexota bacterium]|nr:MAG: hypothetical protein KatS3mg065_1012 [Chloroflexota bacterium]